jgi:hypothetical protein
VLAGAGDYVMPDLMIIGGVTLSELAPNSRCGRKQEEGMVRKAEVLGGSRD